MKQQQTNQIENLVTRRMNTGKLRRVVAMLSAFVLFTTMNTLKFDADTLERVATCGVAAHVHAAECYDAEGAAICGLEEHVHTDACFQQRPTDENTAATRIDDYIPIDAQVNLVTYGASASAQADEAEDGVTVDQVDPSVDQTVRDLDEKTAKAETNGLTVEDTGDAADETPVIDVTGESDAEEIEYTYEIGERDEVLLSAVLEALGIDAGVVSGVDVATNDRSLVRVTENEDGDYAVVPLVSFEKAEIAVFAADGDYVVALTGAVVPEEEKETETEETENTDTENTETEEIENINTENTEIETDDAQSDATEESEPAAQETEAEGVAGEEKSDEEKSGEEAADEAETDEEASDEAETDEEASGEEKSDEEASDEENADEETADEEEDGEEAVDEADTDEQETVEPAGILENGSVTIIPGDDATLSANTQIEFSQNADKDGVVGLLNALLSANRPRKLMAARSRAMAASDESGADNGGQIVDYAVFDISLLDDGVEQSETGEVGVVVRPENVNIFETLPENAAVTGVDYTLYHIHENSVETLPVDVDCDEDGTLLAVDFTTDKFSYFVLKYTVDFEYTDPETGETVAWSWPGVGRYSIASIMSEIDVKGEISDVSLVRTIDVGGSGKVLYLSEDKTELVSEEAFRDTFELTVVVDNRAYVLVVTDDTIDYSSNLADFLALGDLSITGATKNENGTYTIMAGNPYSVSLKFKEIPDVKQFALTEDGKSIKPLTYKLPGAFTPQDMSGTISGNGFNLNYTIATDGTVTFTWEILDADTFKSTVDSNEVEIGFIITGIFTKSEDALEWSDTISTNVDVDDQTHDVEVTKTGSYNEQDHKIWYSVKVTSNGVNNNVVLTDNITSAGILTYNQDVSYPSGKNITIEETSAGGFKALIPQMLHGETYTFTYSADVDFSKLTPDENGKYGTIEQTGNSVTIQSNEDSEPETVIHGLDHEITFSTGGKEVKSGDINDGKRTLNWKISLNSQRIVPINDYINDSITNDPDNLMHYSGDGIKVTKAWSDEAGEWHQETLNLSWEELGVNTENARSWRWNPNDSIPCQYTIEYTTEVDVSQKIVDYQVKNDFSYQYGGDGETGVAQPDANRRVGLEKTVQEYDVANKTVTWSIDIDVPPTGLDKALLTDTLPSAGGVTGFTLNRNAYDTLIGDLVVNVPGLTEGVDYKYEVTVTNVTATNEEVFKNGFTITFMKPNTDPQTKDSMPWVEGLKATGNQYTVTVTAKSQMDPEWVAAAERSNKVETHTNNVELDFGINTIKDKAEVVHNPIKTKMTKSTANKNGSGNVQLNADGSYVPYWSYDILLEGISDSSFDSNDQIVIEDTFNSEYLAVMDRSFATWNDTNLDENNGVLWYDTNGYGSWSNVGKLRVADTRIPGRIVFTIDKSDIQRVEGSGQYYQRYKLTYYLTVKSPEAFTKLMEDAAFEEEGIKKLNNKAEWGDLESDVDVEFEEDIVDKDILTSGYNEKTHTYDVTYTVSINPHGYKLGSDKYITVTDEVNNLSVDYTSITWEPQDAVVNYVRDGSVITYRMKNETPITLIYTCSVHQSGDYTNTVTVHGQTDGKGGRWDGTADGTVSSTDYKIRIFKHDGEDMMKTLAGVHFSLYRRKLNEADNDWSNSNITVVTDKNGQKWEYLKDVVTDENGIVEIDNVPKNDGTDQVADLVADTVQYRLVEAVENSVENIGFTSEDGTKYQPLGYDVLFTIGKEKTANHSDNGDAGYQWVYLNNESLGISNYPVEEDSLDITVKKLWGTTKEGELPVVTLHLYRKQDQYTDAKEPVPGYETFTLSAADVNENGEWVKVIRGLDKNYAYVIEEEPIEGYTITYSESNVLGLIHSGTLSVTNSLVDINVSKVWQDVEGETINDSAVLANLPDVKVRLYKDGAYAGKELILTADQGYEGRWTGLEAGSYTVVEDAPGQQVSIVYTTSDGVEGEALTQSGSAVITNKVAPVTVKKIWKDASGNVTNTAGAASVSISLLKDGSIVSTKTLSADTNWEAVWYDLDSTGNYTFAEANVADYEIDDIIYKDSEGKWYYHKVFESHGDKPYNPEFPNEIIWNEGSEIAYTSPQINGTVEISNKPFEPDDSKIQLHVKKVWNNGEKDLTDAEAKAENLSAKVTLKKYRAQSSGVKIHIWHQYDGSGGKTTIMGAKTENLTVTVNDNQGFEVCYGSENGTIDWNTKWNENKTSFQVNTVNHEDLFIVFYNNSQVVTSVSPAAVVGEREEVVIAPERTVDLNQANDYSASFNNLDVSGTEDGTNYAYSYAIEEVDSGDFDVEYKVGAEGEYKTELTAFDAVTGAGDKTITVKNTKTTTETTDFTVQKRWMDGNGGWYGDNYQPNGVSEITFMLVRKFGDKYWQVDEYGEKVNDNIGKVFNLKQSDPAKIELEYAVEVDSATVGKKIETKAGESTIQWAKTFNGLPGNHSDYFALECSSDGTKVILDTSNDSIFKKTDTNGVLTGGEFQLNEKQQLIQGVGTQIYASCWEYQSNKSGAVLALKNNLKSIEVKKKWEDEENTVSSHPPVTFTLYKNVGGQQTEMGHQTITDATPKDENGWRTAKWTKLPIYDYSTLEKIVYTAVETSAAGYTKETNYTSGTSNDVDEQAFLNCYSDLTQAPHFVAGNLYFTNKLDTVEVQVKKNWQQANGNELEIPVGTTVKLKLYRYVNGDTTKEEVSSITLNGTRDVETDNDSNYEEAWGSATNTNVKNAREDQPWQANWYKLPKYKIDVSGTGDSQTATATEWIYEVKEVEIVCNGVNYTIADGVDATSKWIVTDATLSQNGNSFTGTVTNKLNDVEFGKQWRNASGNPIAWVPNNSQNAGIVISLYRKVKGETNATAILSNQTMTYNSTDKVTIDGKEYNVTWTEGNADNQFVYKFKIEGLPRYVKESETWQEYEYSVIETSASVDGKLYKTSYSTTGQNHAEEYEYIINAEETTYELPSTGGPGTAIFYGSGLALMMFAFLGFILNARKKERDGI